MEQMLKQILEGQAEIKHQITEFKEETKQSITELTHSLARVELTVNEINKTVTGSQKDIMCLLEITATKTQVEAIHNKLNVLNNRLFEQEAKINHLELAK